MKYKISHITKTGCVIPVIEIDGQLQGTDYIETGDFDRARELLSDNDFAKVQLLWTPELIADRRTELAEQANLQATMFA